MSRSHNNDSSSKIFTLINQEPDSPMKAEMVVQGSPTQVSPSHVMTLENVGLEVDDSPRVEVVNQSLASKHIEPGKMKGDYITLHGKLTTAIKNFNVTDDNDIIEQATRMITLLHIQLGTLAQEKEPDLAKHHYEDAAVWLNKRHELTGGFAGFDDGNEEKCRAYIMKQQHRLAPGVNESGLSATALNNPKPVRQRPQELDLKVWDESENISQARTLIKPGRGR